MDSFMQNHQAALDSQREDDAIQYLQDCGVYPSPDNDAVLENLFEDEDTYPPHFQHGYWEHDDFDKLDGKVVSDKMSVHQFGYEIFNIFENYQSEYYLCDFKLLVTKIRELKKNADKLKNLESVFQDLDLVNTKKLKRSIQDD